MEKDFHVGEWLVRPQLSRIQRGEEEIQVELKAMEVLIHLAQQAGEVVLKERLMRGVWPDTFVTDAVLTHAVSELRRAFQDDARNPQVIETLPRRGYRLIAPVSEVTNEEPVARFELKEKIGSGAMGEVRLAEDTILRRPVALKFLLEEVEQDETARKQLLREARSAAALDHPCICKIYDTGQMGGRTFIAMEYLEGETLKQRLGRGPIPLKEAMRITAQVAEALETAAEKKIVHRDIKPSNIMLTRHGRVKVTDFGIARRLPGEGGEPPDWTATLTEDVTTRGTLPYMSPEQVKGSGIDHRSDLFSLGVVFYEMLAGVNPFRQPTQVETANAVLSHMPPDVRRYTPGIPKTVEGIIRKMLVKDPEGRFQSAQEVRLELLRLRDRVAPGMLSRIGEILSWKRIAAGLALIVAITVSGLFLLNRSGSDVSAGELRVVPLTTMGGLEVRPALSPDGSQVVFVGADAEGNERLYVMDIDTRSTRPLTEVRGVDSSPTWHPDGLWITFQRKVRGERGIIQILRVSRLGEDETPITSTSGLLHGGLDYSPDGEYLAYTDQTSPSEPHSIFLLEMKTGEKRRLTRSNTSDRLPAFSPDGKEVAFYRFMPSTGRSEGISGSNPGPILVQSLDDDAPRQVIWDREGVSFLDWAADGRSIIYAGGSAGDRYLKRVPVDGGTPDRLPVGAGANRFSMARKRLVFSRITGVANILRVPGPRAAPDAVPEILIASTRNDRSPQYSPGGRNVAFISDRSGSDELWVADADGKNQEVRTSLGRVDYPRWSPSGDRISFHSCISSDKAGRCDVYIIDAVGGFPKNLTEKGRGGAFANWSSDERFVYFLSEKDQIERMSLETEERKLLTLSEGRKFGPTEFEKRILFKHSETARSGVRDPVERVWSVPAGGGKESLIVDEAVAGFPGFCFWENYLVYLVRHPETHRGRVIKLRDMKTQQTRTIRSLREPFWDDGDGLTVSPDGQWILLSQMEDRTVSDLMLVENFR